MLKNSKKAVLLLTVVATMSLGVANPVLAAYTSASYSGSFSSSWERVKYGDSNNAVLTYGFNTFLINEDYAWAYHYTKSHNASLQNANGFHSGTLKRAGATSKIEVTHNGTSISYYCEY